MASDRQDDEPPFVGPEIQNEYEAELGKFLVGFNQIENYLGSLIVQILAQNDKKDLAALLSDAKFSSKVNYLEIISLTEFGRPVLNSIDFAKLRRVGARRNVLAHGHFEQNPFDGNFIIRTDKGDKLIKTYHVRAYAKEVAEVWETLRVAKIHLIFQHIKLPPMPTADEGA